MATQPILRLEPCARQDSHDGHRWMPGYGLEMEYQLCPGKEVGEMAWPERYCELEAQVHEPHTWKRADTGWSRCPGSGPEKGIDVVAIRPQVTVAAIGYKPYNGTLDRLLLVAEDALTRFAAKNMEYQGTHLDLQPHADRAQFIDINRKVLKLRQAIWEGADTTEWSEQPKEIVHDLLGHCLLLLDIIRLQEKP